jgi:uncharacterized protein (DUF488 family)
MITPARTPDLCIYTVGHGNRPLVELLALLSRCNVQCLVDVRAHPGSRRHPHFGRDALARSFAEESIAYMWEGAALGGAPAQTQRMRRSEMRASVPMRTTWKPPNSRMP